jgi:hypothetical protein
VEHPFSPNEILAGMESFRLLSEGLYRYFTLLMPSDHFVFCLPLCFIEELSPTRQQMNTAIIGFEYRDGPDELPTCTADAGRKERRSFSPLSLCFHTFISFVALSDVR